MALASHGVVVTLLDIGGRPLPSIRTNRNKCFVGRPHQVLVEVHGAQAMFTLSAEINGERVASQVIDTRITDKCWFSWPLPSGRMLMIPPSITQAQLRCSQPLLVPFGKVRVSVSRVEAAGPQQRAWAPAAVGASSLRQDSLCWGRTVEQLPDVQVFFDSAEAMFMRGVLKIPQHTAILRASSHPAVTQALAAAHNAAVAAAVQAATQVVEAQEAQEAQAAAAKEAAARAAAAQAAQAAATAAQAAAAARAVQEAAAEEAAAAAQVAAAAAQVAAAVAQEVQERADEVIDLTHEPVVRLVVDGREQRYDELAVCDLVDSDDEEEDQDQEERRACKKLRWALVKKPVVDLVMEEEDEGE